MNPTAQELIRKLQELKQPDRHIDRDLALLVGYRPEQETTSGRVLWFAPNGTEPVRIPAFTSSLDHARDLADIVAPGRAVACTWKHGLGYAEVDGGPPVQAATTEIALCIAALNASAK